MNDPSSRQRLATKPTAPTSSPSVLHALAATRIRSTPRVSAAAITASASSLFNGHILPQRRNRSTNCQMCPVMPSTKTLYGARLPANCRPNAGTADANVLLHRTIQVNETITRSVHNLVGLLVHIYTTMIAASVCVSVCKI